jgi:CubicO group peptidase (beta-lactamase class C family)
MRIAALLLCLLLPLAPARASLPDDAAIAAELRAYVEDAKQAPAVVVGVLEDGRTRIVAHGLDGGAVAPGDRLFEIGSISKVFTALLLARMVEAGEVTEDQRIGTLFPPEHPLREPLASITLGELASHASGLPRLPKATGPLLRVAFGRDPYAGSTADEIFRSVATLTDENLGPKGRFAYSNLGVALLGQLLARRLGTDYESALRRRVFEPLGLAPWPLSPLPASDPRFVQGHRQNFRPAPAWHLDAYAPAGGLQAGANPLLAFAATQLGDPPAWVDDAQRPRLDIDAATGRRSALGWAISRVGPREVWWHNGGTGGFRTHLALVPADGVALVVLTNAVGDADVLARRLLDPAQPPPRAQANGILSVFVTLGGLLLATILPLAVSARVHAYASGQQRRSPDRIDVLGIGLSMGVILLLMERMGDFSRVPWAAWWAAAITCAAGGIHLARRALPWPWRADRGWRSGLRIAGMLFTAVVLALLL